MGSETEADHEVQTNHTYKVAPEQMYPVESIPALWVREYRLWFVNRREFLIQNHYSTPESYESKGGGYFRSKHLLEDQDIVRHLCGIDTMALYAMNAESNTSKWFCLDADCDQADDWLRTIRASLKEDGVSSALENSRRGGHLWILCEEPLPADQARIYLYNLLDSLSIPISGIRGNPVGVEVNPKQDSLGAGQFGNAVRGPLGVHRKDKNRYWFRDAAPDLKSQFGYLRKLPRLCAWDLELLTLSMTMPEDLTPPPPPPLPAHTPHCGLRAGARFDIRDYTPTPRRMASGRGDYFTACPSCRARGKDTHGDNLHVTPARDGGAPVFYCHAQCSFTEIRNACLGRS